MGSTYTLEGQGALLQHGRLVARVDYHLSLPTQTHFVTSANPTLHPDEHLAGFILLPKNQGNLPLQAYTLELTDKQRLPIVVERRYKTMKHRGQTRVSFWVKLDRA
ncbi:MAG: hypothetical protein ACE5H9_15670 [Anaerolineae bacterium]